MVGIVYRGLSAEYNELVDFMLPMSIVSRSAKITFINCHTGGWKTRKPEKKKKKKKRIEEEGNLKERGKE